MKKGKPVEYLVYFFQLIRLKYHRTYLIVVAGCFGCQADSPDPTDLLLKLLLLYFSFNFLLYGGLYTLNSISDYQEDKLLKPGRVLPSGKISITTAKIICGILLLSGFVTGYLLLNTVGLLLYTVFVVFNLVYNYLLRNIKYIGILFISLTIPLRVYLGSTLSGQDIPLLIYLGFYLFFLSHHISKKNMENSSHKIPVRLVYIFFIGMLLLSPFAYPNCMVLYLIILIVFLYYNIFPLHNYFGAKKRMEKIWDIPDK